MGDIVAYPERIAQFGLVAGGSYLVNAAFRELRNLGIRVTQGAIERLVNNGANTVGQIVRYFERRQPNQYRSRLQKKMAPQVGAKRPRKNNNDGPAQLRLAANATLGNIRDYTNSKSVASSKGGKSNRWKKRMKSLDKWFTARWQSITADPRQKMSLGMELLGWTTGGNSHLALPMYAFDCNCLPFNVHNAGSTKTFHKLESIPFYRLYKQYSTGTLETASQNYFWAVQNGLNNGPSNDYSGTSDPVFHPLNLDCGVVNTIEFKPNYTVFDIFVNCPRTMSCRMHFAVVRFMNDIGPERFYANNVTWSGTTNYPYSTIDDMDNNMVHKHDVFWESFWDNKIGHPLTQYNNPTKEKYIEVIKDDVLTITPEDTNVPTDVHIRHRKQIVVKNGTWYNTDNDYRADKQIARSSALGEVGGLPPIGSSDRYGLAWGYNTISKDEQAPGVYDFGEDAKAKNTWLCIWMEDLSVSSTKAIRQLTGDEITNYNRPEVVIPSNHSCSFDIKVERHCTIDPIGTV